MKTCERCGKDFKLFHYTYYTTKEGNEIVLCNDCRKKVKAEEKEREKIRAEERKEEKKNVETKFKENINCSNLTAPELQLQKIMEMKEDVSTIKNIMVFYLILFLISLIITVATLIITFT